MVKSISQYDLYYSKKKKKLIQYRAVSQDIGISFIPVSGRHLAKTGVTNKNDISSYCDVASANKQTKKKKKKKKKNSNAITDKLTP